MENEQKVNDLNISQKIPLYPLNGHSNFLIDKFYIFGYDSSTLTKYLLNDNNIKNFMNEKKQIEENKFQKFQIDEIPTLLNEFTSDYEKECLDIDMIKEMILPNKINLFYLEEEKSYSRSPEKRKKREHFTSKHSDSFKNDKNEDNFSIYDEDDFIKREVPPSYNVVFSSNPQSGNNSKKSINGFAYIFYKKLKAKKEINKNTILSFYAPIIFCIISEFPFYNSFYQLCMQIEYLFSNNELRTPLEIIIYSIIALSPSPLNSEVILSLKPLINYRNEEKINLKNNIINETIEETNEDNENINTSNKINKIQKEINNKNINKKESLKRNSDIKFAYRLSTLSNANVLKHLKTISTSKSYRENNIKSLSDDKKFKKIKFDFLTGYPIIQYNLEKVLLQNLSPLDVIDIFLYTFLEKDVLFFSKDIELLSLTINSYLNLNFPLNDEKYYFINACVSYNNYINGNSTFVGSTFTTIIGINDSYNPKYQINSMNKLKEHIAVDLDNGKVYKVEDKSDKEKSKKNKELFSFIKSICKNKEIKGDKNILYREINLLNKVLTDIYSKMTDKVKYNNYIDYSEDNIKQNNLKIQDSFYRFIINLCLYVYQNLSIKTDADDMKLVASKMKNKNNKSNNETETEMNVLFLDEYKEDENYSKEELYFLEELTETMKFQSFVYSFVQSYNPIDLYKIPLTFTEEFISIIARKSNILQRQINFFSLIDKLYKFNSEGELNIDLEDYINEYNVRYKNYLDREIQDICEENKFHENKIKMKNFLIDNIITIKYKSYELDDRILMKYLQILNILENEENNNNNNIIYLNLKKRVKENIPKYISVTDIETVIENYAIEEGILSESDLCSANIIILFTLSFRKFKNYMECQSFLGSLFQDFTIFRKYYSMIMSMIYKVYEESVEKKNYIRAKDCFYLYYLCINSLRSVKLIPNESLMNIIKKFNKIRIDSLKEEGSNSNIQNQIDYKKKDVKLYGVDLPEDDITYKNLYITYNFNSYKVYKEKEIVKKINEPKYSSKFFLSIDGNDSMQPKIKFNNGVHSFNSFFYSQKLLLLSLVEEYKNFIVDTNEENLRAKIILDACLNIFIFMRNSKDFTDKSDIIEMVKVIFYIFMNHFLAINMNNI